MIQEVLWQDIRSQVREVNSELADIIDQLNPDKRYPFIRADYKFGDLIVEKGVLNLPIENNLVSHNRLPYDLRELLAYSKIPLGLLLNKTSEIFVNEEERVIPLITIEPGDFFGTFETLDFVFNSSTSQIWNITAGCRSIFILPKISEQAGCNRLRLNYGLPSSLRMKDVSEHWLTMKHIANHPNFKQQWQSNIILFTSAWFKDKKNDPAWYNFERYLFKQGWLQSQVNVDKTKFGLLWQLASRKISTRNLKPTTYILDTIKHIISLSVKTAMAFAPADDSQQIAPTKELQNVFLDTYRLKNYYPTIMYPVFLSKKSIYYSLSMPTLLEGTPYSKQNSSTFMLDVRDIKLLIDTIAKQSATDLQILNHINFEYFHVEKDLYGEIQPSTDVCEKDNRFISPNDAYQFCATSQFWRGCIKMTLKPNQTE